MIVNPNEWQKNTIELIKKANPSFDGIIFAPPKIGKSEMADIASALTSLRKRQKTETK